MRLNMTVLMPPRAAVKLPLRQCLHPAGDPCAPVAAAADAAIACICTHCGYEGSLSRLLSENADYVVDGVCARLRAMSSNSRWAASVWTGHAGKLQPDAKRIKGAGNKQSLCADRG